MLETTTTVRTDRGSLAASVSRLRGPKDLVFEIEVIDAANIGPREILIETEFSAISPGTELAAYVGMAPLRPGPVYPRLMGYCNCGRVIAAGEAVFGVGVGDRVLTHAAHRSHYRVTMGEVLAIVPPNLDGAQASVTYLFHLGHMAQLRAKLQAGQRVAVIGLGALGMASIAVARSVGAHVTALSHRSRAFDLAQRFGAHSTQLLGSGSEIVAEADVVITTANGWDDWLVALQAARNGGTIAVLGFPGRGAGLPLFNPLASQYFYDKQLTLLAVGYAKQTELSEYVPFLLDRIAQGRLPAEAMARHRRPARELASAYEDLLERPQDVLTYVLEW